jgi:hypothetical protein
MLFKKEYNIKGETIDVLVYDKLSYDVIKNHPKNFVGKKELLVMFVDENEAKDFRESYIEDVSTYVTVAMTPEKDKKDLTKFVDKLMKFEVSERWSSFRGMK